MFRRGSLLRYCSALGLWLMGMAWVASVWLPFGFSVRTPDHQAFYIVSLKHGTLQLYYDEIHAKQSIYNYYVFGLERTSSTPGYREILGQFRVVPIRSAAGVPNSRTGDLGIPLAVLFTAMLPLIVGAFAGFRFRLWQFFAYSALVAMQLAYFLR